MKIERKTLRFKADDFDEEQGIFSGYAAVFGNVDSGGDVIEPGAFAKTLEAGWERVKILALHNDCWLPVGRPLELKEDEHGLYIKGMISDTSMGRDIKALLRDKGLNEMSIGYDPVTFDYDKDAGIRHLREVNLWEVSIVTWAMNPEAIITGYKADEIAGKVGRMAEDIARDLKEGRKISTVRMTSLKDACSSMEAAVKALKAIIKEAEGEKSAQPRAKPQAAVTKGHKPTIEILFH